MLSLIMLTYRPDRHHDVTCRVLSGQNLTHRGGPHRTVCMAGAASEKLQALIFDCDGKALEAKAHYSTVV